MCFKAAIALFASSLLSLPLAAQPLRPPETPVPEEVAPRQAAPEQPQQSVPLVLRSAEAQAPLEGRELLDDRVARLRQRLRDIANHQLSEAEQEAEVARLRADYPLIFRDAEVRSQSLGSTPEQIEATLYQKIYAEVERLSPREERAEDSLAPVHPPLLRRRQPVVVSEGDLPQLELDLESQQVAELEESPEPPQPVEPEKESRVKVEVLANEEVTESMHDDTTVLRNVEADDGGQLLFGRFHVWVGGAVQYDVHRTDGLFGLQDNGSLETDSNLRRAEAIVRASLFEDGEVKAQYDLDQELWRDLYWRWVSDDQGQVFTVGNQKEPFGLDFLAGNKYSAAMERSAPNSAFGSFRSMGLRYNNWWGQEGHYLGIGPGRARESAVTTTFGIFTEGLDSGKDTDLAATGRITYGWQTFGSSGLHLGLAATLRDGEFDRIDPRPESQNSERVNLANFDADRQAAVSLEGLYVHGSFYGQAELTFSDYSGGDTDATGWGGYVQGAWSLGGVPYSYRPRWGLMAPIQAQQRHVFELFSRFSYSAGDSDEESSNHLGILSAGVNWYHRNWRASFNLMLAESDRDVEGEDSGDAINLRLQYIF